MANIRLRWDLPTQREDGRQLAVSEIAGVFVGMRVQGIAEYTEIAFVQGGEYVVTDLEPGTYEFELVVEDRQLIPRRSASVEGDINIPVPILAAPRAIANLTVVIL